MNRFLISTLYCLTNKHVTLSPLALSTVEVLPAPLVRRETAAGLLRGVHGVALAPLAEDGPEPRHLVLVAGEHADVGFLELARGQTRH